MTAYAIAHLRTPTTNDDVLEYIERVQTTMDSYQGHFVVHGADIEVIEGAWPGTVVIVAFPDLATAHAWYDSPKYREILHLRTDHIQGDLIFVEGVPPAYDARKTAASLRAHLSATTAEQGIAQQRDVDPRRIG
jgi:uncharacterized protein (DUF1330 family)